MKNEFISYSYTSYILGCSFTPPPPGSRKCGASENIVVVRILCPICHSSSTTPCFCVPGSSSQCCTAVGVLQVRAAVLLIKNGTTGETGNHQRVHEIYMYTHLVPTNSRQALSNNHDYY